jgi:branched-chain amino acid transport system permease protein
VSTFVQHVVDASALGSFYALFALGIALIFGIMRLVNFAHGELITVGSYAVYLTQSLSWPFIILAAVGASIAMALITERIAFRPVRGANPATLLITSFAVSYLLQSAARLIFTSLPKSANINPLLLESFTVKGVFITWLTVLTLGVTGALLVALAIFLRRTAMGMQMRAAAEDFDAARLCSVDANRVVAVAFGLSGLLAGAAALLLVGQTGSLFPTMGLTPVLFGFTAAVIGGMGSLWGAVLGGYVLGAGSTLLTIELPNSVYPFRDAFLFAFVLIVLSLRPDGIVRARGAVTRV